MKSANINKGSLRVDQRFDSTVKLIEDERIYRVKHPVLTTQKWLKTIIILVGGIIAVGHEIVI